MAVGGVGCPWAANVSRAFIQQSWGISLLGISPHQAQGLLSGCLNFCYKKHFYTMLWSQEPWAKVASSHGNATVGMEG